MNRVEFIGGSYVGKTTLFRQLEIEVAANDRYITRHKAQLDNREKLGKLKFFQRKLTEYAVTKLGGDYNLYAIPELEHIDEEFLRIYEDAIAFSFSEMTIAQKGVNFAYGSLNRVLKQVRRFNKYHLDYFSGSHDRIILVEEAIIHWLIVEWPELLMSEISKETLFENGMSSTGIREKNGLFPRGIVCCYTDADTFLERIKKREMKQQINRRDKGKSHDAILEQVLDFQNIAQAYAAHYEHHGGRVLYVDTKLDLMENVKKVISFLNSL